MMNAYSTSLHTFVVLAYKESSYLEDCIQSVIHQSVASKVVLATSTPNDFIHSIAKKYNLPVISNPTPGKGIGFDFDFARCCVNSELVTIAHQDDIYDETYAADVIKAYQKYPDTLIVFSDYYEIRKNQKIYSNTNLKIKRLLLLPARLTFICNWNVLKRLPLAFGNSICCPAVTFSSKNIHLSAVFACNMKCNIDWYAWEKLSKEKGRFLYIPKALMGHRVHQESTTTEIIEEKIRTKEDFIMFQKFWPSFIAKRLNQFYVKSEESNQS